MTKWEYVELVKNRILEKIQPHAIVLFGSVAKGSDHEDSDLDILVVWDEQKELSNIKRRIYIRRIVGMLDTPVDILTCTTDEFAKALSDETSFTSHIIKEGEVIYGRLG